jgi:hypothetical protein
MKAMALQRLSTSSSQNQPSAGTSRVFPPHPRARNLPSSPLLPPSSSFRVFAFSRTVRALSDPSQPPPAAPGRGRSSRLPIIDSRSYGVSSRNFFRGSAWGFLPPFAAIGVHLWFGRFAPLSTAGKSSGMVRNGLSPAADQRRYAPVGGPRGSTMHPAALTPFPSPRRLGEGRSARRDRGGETRGEGPWRFRLSGLSQGSKRAAFSLGGSEVHSHQD